MFSSRYCCDCNAKKESAAITGSYQCDLCKDKSIERLKRIAVEFNEPEDRKSFLYRMADNIKLDRTKEEIDTMIKQGFNDFQILEPEEFKIVGFKEHRKSKVYYMK